MWPWLRVPVCWDLGKKVGSPGQKPRGPTCSICMWALGHARCWGWGRGTPGGRREVAVGTSVVYEDCVLCGSCSVGGLCCLGSCVGEGCVVCRAVPRV